MYRRSIASLALVLAMIMAPAQAQAREFLGLLLPEEVTLEGTDDVLQLNGVGIRSKWFFDIYIGALYTPEPAETRDAVQAMKGPKRVFMRFLYDKVDREDMASAWTEGFEANTTPEQYEKLGDRVRRFSDLFPAMEQHDIVLLDYLPGSGTRVTINGEDRAVIEGADFYRALLDIWLGEDPVDDELKEAMLGAPYQL